jgi:cell wall-associated NlpC family hydrolase
MTPFYKISFILSLIILLGSCASSKNNRSDYHANRNYSYKQKSKLSKHSLLRDELIINASKYAGTPYKYGGKKPSSGFDCSGFISYVYNKSGLSADGASYQQANLGSYVGFSDLKPGDLLFFGNKEKVSHVAMVYSVKNKNISVIHSTKSRGVIVETITNSRYWQKKYLFSKNLISLHEQADLAHSNN